MGLLLVGRLLQIQLVHAEELKQHAMERRGGGRFLYSRGRILDRNGEVLAEDTFVYDLYAHPEYYHGQTPEQIAEALAPYLDKSKEELESQLKQTNRSTLTLARNLPSDRIEAIANARIDVPLKDPKTGLVLTDERGQPRTKKQAIQGLDPYRKPQRRYPQGAFASHMLGFVNDSASVSSGVEASAGDKLRQAPMLASLVTDGRGLAYNWHKQSLNPLMGLVRPKDIQLTLDARVQHVAENALKTGIERAKAERGTVIVMNPRNGEVLAFATLPQFNPQTFYEGTAEELKNWAITDVYPPGSTIKILTVASGLEAGTIKPDEHILDTGRMMLSGWPIQNYDYYKHPHPGYIDLEYLFVHSSNIASAKIAMGIPTKQYHELLGKFGLGKRTGIDVPGESSGLFPDPESWTKLSQATMGYGYGLASTPLQMAAAVAAIANDGVWMPPHVISKDSLVAFKGRPRRVLKSSTAKTVTRLLATSIEHSPKHPAHLPVLHVAGKTGTSRKPSPDGKGYSNDLYTSFVGYFPANAPEMLVMVVVDSPKMGESWGSTVAAPIFREVALEASQYLGIKAPKFQASQAG